MRPVFDLDREGAGAALVGAGGSARRQIDHPVVQRAGDAGAVDDALRQRAARVGAAVADREDFVFGCPEDGDVAVRGLDHAGAGRRDVGDAADFDPGEFERCREGLR